jgi:hypothetical protein
MISRTDSSARVRRVSGILRREEEARAGCHAHGTSWTLHHNGNGCIPSNVDLELDHVSLWLQPHGRPPCDKLYDQIRTDSDLNKLYQKKVNVTERWSEEKTVYVSQIWPLSQKNLSLW